MVQKDIIDIKKHVPPFQERLQAEKGSVEYNHSKHLVCLHVFWILSNEEAVQAMLQGLSACATATERDTPCTPTYFRVHRGHPYVTLARERFGGSCRL